MLWLSSFELESTQWLVFVKNGDNIIELVDSISRDDPGVTYIQCITKTKISRERYTFKTSNLQNSVLSVILRNPAVPRNAFSPSCFFRIQGGKLDTNTMFYFIFHINLFCSSRHRSVTY